MIFIEIGSTETGVLKNETRESILSLVSFFLYSSSLIDKSIV